MTRRQFIHTTAMTPTLIALASQLNAQDKPAVKIERAEVFPALYPMAGYFKFFTGAHNSAGRPAVFLKLTASDGTVAWGQSVPISKWTYETLETSHIVLRDYFAPAIIGKDPHDLASIHAAMDYEIAPSFSTGMPITRAAVDIAVWDMLGRIHKKNIAEFWNLKPVSHLTLSWTLNPRTLDEVEGLIEAGRKRGYRNFNTKVAPDPKFDVELTKLVRKLAPDTFLWADGNTGYELAIALEAAPKLRDAGADVLESPIKPNRISGYQALVKQGALPIIMDEGLVSPVELEEFIKFGMLNGIAAKPSRCGGLTSNKKQIELCLQNKLMWLGSGLTDPDVSLAATLILFGAFGQTKPCALNGPQFLVGDVLKTPLKIADGKIEVPTGPGLGIEVDEEKVKALRPKNM
ncbi:MAG: mandelate racemase/muconate lactonizing enzyme family protein [Tepidisphaerales bacterium]